MTESSLQRTLIPMHYRNKEVEKQRREKNVETNLEV